MTEKQFRYIEATDEVDEHIIDYSTEPHFEYYTLKGATDKLNELNDENEFLKFALDSNREVTMEVEQEQCRLYKKLEKENKELKQLIKKVMDERVVDYPLLCKLKEMVEK